MTCSAQAVGTPTPCNVPVQYGSSPVPSRNVANVAWDWGDYVATQTSGPTATHQDVSAGGYTVIATVIANTTDGSKTATTSTAITVP